MYKACEFLKFPFSLVEEVYFPFYSRIHYGIKATIRLKQYSKSKLSMYKGQYVPLAKKLKKKRSVKNIYEIVTNFKYLRTTVSN
jgi:hypothetical protein